MDWLTCCDTRFSRILLPSGVTSKKPVWLLVELDASRWVAPNCNPPPTSFTGTEKTDRVAWLKKNSSLPSRLHCGAFPPLVETCHLA